MWGEIEPGTIVAIKRRAYRVESVTHPKDVPGAKVPEGWSEHDRDNAIVVELVGLDDGNDYRAVLPTPRPYARRHGYGILATPALEGHWPRCGSCGEPWPCSEVDAIHAGRRMADAMESRLQRETEYPVPCPAGCRQRFRTERGATQHVARSRRHNQPAGQ